MDQHNPRLGYVILVQDRYLDGISPGRDRYGYRTHDGRLGPLRDAKVYRHYYEALDVTRTYGGVAWSLGRAECEESEAGR